MKTISHTPGPWTLAGGRVIETTSGEFAVNRTTGDGWRRSPRELDANARLVAAAPELLEALRRCADRLGDMDCGDELDAARAAIAKAEGRG